MVVEEEEEGELLEEEVVVVEETLEVKVVAEKQRKGKNLAKVPFW